MFGMISSVVFFHNLFVFYANVRTVKKSTFDGFHGLPVDPYFFFLAHSYVLIIPSNIQCIWI
jgi:hypothetical protein